jgi:hypothetical protein
VSDDPGRHGDWLDRIHRRRGTRDGEWDEPGSDELMDFHVLARVRQIGYEADAQRERKMRRRGE